MNPLTLAPTSVTDAFHAAWLAKARSFPFSKDPTLYADYLEKTLWLLLSKFSDEQRAWAINIYGLDSSDEKGPSEETV